MRVYPEDTLESADWIKKILPPVWVGIIQSTVSLNRTQSQRKDEFDLFLNWDVYLLPSDISTPCSWAFGLRPGLCNIGPLNLRPSDWHWLTPLPLPGLSSLQTADCRTSQLPWPCELIPIVNLLFTSISIFISSVCIFNYIMSYWFCFSGDA